MARSSELLTVGAFGTEDVVVPLVLRLGAGAARPHRRRAGRRPYAARPTLTPEEADAVLIDHDRLDGWINFAYRALKSDRDGRALEARLDAAESVPWLLDVVFAIAGRVRPYNKYLPWELRTHPVDGWPADELLGLVERSLDGDVAAVRETFPRVRAACAAYDAQRGHTRTTDMIDGWSSELDLFASPADLAHDEAEHPAHRAAVAGQHRRETAGRRPPHLAADHDAVADDRPPQPPRQPPVDACLRHRAPEPDGGAVGLAPARARAAAAW